MDLYSSFGSVASQILLCDFDGHINYV
jgi:hypothetical protein